MSLHVPSTAIEVRDAAVTPIVINGGAFTEIYRIQIL